MRRSPTADRERVDLAAPHRPPLRDPSGFSLIEVLVVVLVISILAAIAIPLFLGQEDKAQDSKAKTDLRTVVQMVEECKLEQKSYRDCDRAEDLDGAPGVTWGTAAGNAGMVADGDEGYFAYAVSNAKRSDGQNHIYIWQKQSSGSSLRWCFTDNPPSHGGCKGTSW